jgi:hypothetical protein
MSWSLGYDDKWKRWIGYGVPAYCDFPGCDKKIDRGLSHVCGGEPYGGEKGCGLYFCSEHLEFSHLCTACEDEKEMYLPKPEHPEWIQHLLTHKSWQLWRKENPEEVKKLKLLRILNGGLNEKINGTPNN